MGVGKPDKTTPLYAEMHIACELLHCSHGEFLGLPPIERDKLRFYLMVKSEKQKKEIEDIKEGKSQRADDGPNQTR